MRSHAHFDNKPLWRGTSAAFVLLCLLTAFALAAPTLASATERVALVIGNSTNKDAPLKPAHNSARFVAKRLRSTGFTVLELKELDRNSLFRALDRFVERLDNTSVGFIYFAGSGYQRADGVHLLAADSSTEDAASPGDSGVAAAPYLQAASKRASKLFAVIDLATPKGVDGLPPLSLDGFEPGADAGSTNAMVALGYSVPEEQQPRYLPIGQMLAEFLDQAGATAEGLLRRLEQSERTQQLVSATHGDAGAFVLREPSKPGQTEPPLSPEQQAWRAVSASDNYATHRDFLKRFPNSRYASQVRTLLAELGPQLRQRPRKTSAGAGGQLAAAKPPPPAAKPAGTSGRNKSTANTGAKSAPKSAKGSAQKQKRATTTIAGKKKHKFKLRKGTAVRIDNNAKVGKKATNPKLRVVKPTSTLGIRGTRFLVKLPSLPWPPPAPSTRMVIPRDLLLAATQSIGGKTPTLKDISSLLGKALRDAGYWEQVYYQVPDSNGVALVTRIERIEADGTPVEDESRFVGTAKRQSFSLKSFVQDLLFEPKGLFRLGVFVISDRPFVPDNKSPKMSVDEASKLLAEGMSTLPSPFAEVEFGDEFFVEALIYEFSQAGGKSKVTQLKPSRLPADTHLRQAGVLDLLEKRIN